MTTVALVGSTGLVGSHILSTLLALPSVTNIHCIARRAPPSDSSEKVHAHISSDTATWTSTFASMSPPPTIFLSGLGTTRAAAGSVAAQRLVDYDMNLALAKAAKAAGVRVYVLISSAGTSSSSMLAYSKMKGQLEEAVRALDFDRTVIVRPGLIVGEREESRFAEGVFRGIANQAGRLTLGLKDFWAQDAVVIGRAAVHAGLTSEQVSQKVWVLEQKDVVTLGRKEWDAFEAGVGKQ